MSGAILHRDVACSVDELLKRFIDEGALKHEAGDIISSRFKYELTIKACDIQHREHSEVEKRKLRFEMACAVASGYFSKPVTVEDMAEFPKHCVALTDAILAELEKPKSTQNS
jgi:hypothetical protein